MLIHQLMLKYRDHKPNRAGTVLQEKVYPARAVYAMLAEQNLFLRQMFADTLISQHEIRVGLDDDCELPGWAVQMINRIRDNKENDYSNGKI